MLNIVILAAGLGKRMQSDLPKVLHPVAGKPMLAHVLDNARKLGPDRIVVVVGHGADRVRQAFADDADVSFALQVPQQGTGHAVQLAAPLLLDNQSGNGNGNGNGSGNGNGAEAAIDAAAGTTLVLYGDVPLVQPETMARLIRARAAGMAVLTQTLDDPAGYGRIVRDEAGAVQRIVEHKDAAPEEHAIREVNTGILAVPTAWLKTALPRIGNDNAQGEYYLTDLIGLAVRDGVAVNSAEPGADWETLGVNSRAQQAQVERIWQGEQAQRLLEKGVTLADPARLDIRGSLECGRDVFIDVGCVIEGRVTLADGVRIGPFCVLRNAAVGRGTHIDAYTHVQDAVIADEARIGPYARLRPGADIGPGAHVGNFVEIKKSTLGRASKANHLSYIGDATIGERVNIGAGTITCNYDGVNKFRTVIEDDVFVGSDTQLVAPVTVGKGATLGAGTTLTRDAPADQLTLSRSPQKSIPGWKRPGKKS